MANNTNRPTISTLTPGGAFETGVGTTFASATGAAGLDGRGIMSANVTADGMLTFTFTDGTTSATFDILGPAGAMGDPGAQGPMGDPGAAGAAGPQGDPGAAGATGAQGAMGDPGTGIASIVDNGDGTVTINYDDGTTPLTITIPTVAGPEGPQGDQGATGAAGAAGPAGVGIAQVVIDGGTDVSGSTRYALTIDYTDGVDPDTVTFLAPQGPRGADGSGLGALDDVPTDGSQQAVRSAGVFTADQTLQANIDAEETAREAADTTLQTNIDAKQDANIIVANATELEDVDADDHARGTLIIEEDTGEIYYIDTSGARNIVHATDIRLTEEVFGSQDVTTDPSRIDTNETDIAALQTETAGLETDITGLTTRVTANEGSITNITDTFVADIRIDLADSETAASTDADGNFDATADERHAARLVSATRVSELITSAIEGDPAIPFVPDGDPDDATQGDVWYNGLANTIRYARSDTDFVTVAIVSDTAITGITGPIATADGGLQYTATRQNGDTVVWTTQQGSTPAPGTAHFFANINPHTIAMTSTAADVEVTVSLGVTGTGFTYTGFSGVVPSDPDGGLTPLADPVDTSGTASSFTFTVNSGIESTITINGLIDYTDPNGDALTHDFSLTTQVTATTPSHIYFTYAPPTTTVFDLSNFTDTGVVATDRAEFTFTENPNGGVDDLVIAYPDTLNPIGIFGPFGQYTPATGEGLQTDITTFTGGGGLSIYTLSGFLTEGRLTFREL